MNTHGKRARDDVDDIDDEIKSIQTRTNELREHVGEIEERQSELSYETFVESRTAIMNNIHENDKMISELRGLKRRKIVSAVEGMPYKPWMHRLINPSEPMMWENDNAMLAYINRLITCDPQQLGSGVELYPTGGSLLGLSEYPNMLVRQSSRIFLDRVLSSIGERVEKNPSLNSLTILSGSPGVGKSRFLELLLRSLLLRGEIVFVELKKLSMVLLMLPGSVRGDPKLPYMVLKHSGSDLPMLLRTRCPILDPTTSNDSLPYLLVDPFEIGRPTELWVELGAHVVMALSSRSETVLNIRKRRNTDTLFLGPWTEDELVVLCGMPECGPWASSISESDVRRRYHQFGGVIRVVYGDNAVVSKHVRHIENCLMTYSDDTLLNLMGTGDVTDPFLSGDPTATREGGMTSSLVSLNPTADGRNVTATIASSMMQCLIAARLLNQLSRWTSSSKHLHTDLFEKVCMVAIARPDIVSCQLLWRRLSGRTARWAPFVPSQACIRTTGRSWEEFDRSWVELWRRDVAAGARVVMCPRSSNYPVIDFVCSDGNAYQSTVSTVHPISGVHALTMLHRLGIVRVTRPTSGRKWCTAVDGVKLNIFFVAPSSHTMGDDAAAGAAATFTAQKFKWDGGKLVWDQASDALTVCRADTVVDPATQCEVKLNEADRAVVRSAVVQHVIGVPTVPQQSLAAWMIDLVEEGNDAVIPRAE